MNELLKKVFKKEIKISKKDKEIFNEIEKVREELKNNDSFITFLDFGAGSPTEKRSKEIMENGVLTQKTIKELCSIGLKGKWAILLYFLVKEFRPQNILELGTCCGFSAIYMSKANPFSNIYTIEGSEEIAEIAKQNFNKLNCKNIKLIVGKFQNVLPSLLNDINKLDLVFIDGHHRKDYTIIYFRIIKKFLNPNAIIIIDDINWSDEMKESWEIIKKDKIVKNYINLYKLGIIFT